MTEKRNYVTTLLSKQRSKNHQQLLYENFMQAPIPDDQSVEEYEDFKHLINHKIKGNKSLFSWGSIVVADESVEVNLTVFKDDERQQGFRLGGDIMVTGWLGRRTTRNGKIWGAIDRLYDESPDIINSFIDVIGRPGNYIFWRRCRPEGCKTRTMNQARSSLGGSTDRIDIALECLRRKYSDCDQAQIPSYMKKVFDVDSNYFDLFNSWAGFVNFFELEGSFVQKGKVVNLENNTVVFECDKDGIPVASLFEDDKMWLRSYFINCKEAIKFRSDKIEEILSTPTGRDL